jgi:ferredoxin/flavodoxin
LWEGVFLKAIIFYFSGTGNTEEVMKMLTDALRRQGVQVDCHRVDTCLRAGVIPPVSGYDAVGIGYPVYAFNVPGAVARFIKMLPGAGSKPVFVFKTAGEPFVFNEPSSRYIYSRLRKKGYDLNYERLFLMPYNVMFRYSDEVVKQIYTLSQKLAQRMALDIARGAENRPRFNPFLVFISLVLRIQWPGAALNGRLQRAGKACNGCRKCVRECRTGNIRLENGKIRFGWRCTMCMRCIMYCPQKAVSAGLLELWAVRGAYDFRRIVGDPTIRGDYIQNCSKGVFSHFKKYVAEVEALTAECDINDNSDKQRVEIL